MDLLGNPNYDDHQEIALRQDPATGLTAVVAVHRYWAGLPSLGGCRLRDYSSGADAFDDVLKLSRAMSYKSVMAGLSYGGAKAVILGSPEPANRQALFRAMGAWVDSFQGRFRTGVDVGITPDDVAIMATQTPYMVGTADLNPAEVTAHSVFQAILTTAKDACQLTELAGVRVCVQGLGKVGMTLAALLSAAGARLIVSDIDRSAVAKAQAQFGARFVAPERAHAVEAEIFSPCALGGVINTQTIDELKVEVVAGAANNQLIDTAMDQALRERGILYAPDYVANCGGLLAVAYQLNKADHQWLWQKVASIESTLHEIYSLSRRQQIPTGVAADTIARRRMADLEHRSSQAA